ncbi:MAG: alginate lyase family protein, partial [Candidatus Daviesbacteria bacterium]|nr:alginate lyase family protein [Candidatus Daviesbacteria bacterium]
MNILNKNPLVLLGLFILIVSIPITVYLAQKQQIFKSRAEEVPLNFTLNPNHPRLLLDAQEVAQVKEKIITQTWAKNNFARYEWTADCLVGRVTVGCGNYKPQVEIPNEATLTSHNYLCPSLAGSAAGSPLDYGRYDPAKGHYCAANNTYYPGNTPAFLNITQPAGARLITLQDIRAYYKHEENMSALLSLGLAYQVSTQPDSVKILYAQKAREILLSYAQKYPNWKIHDSYGCWMGDSPGCPITSSFPKGVNFMGGKMYSQSLNDANWIDRGAAAGYDFVYDSGVFSAADKQLIENNLFRKMVETIRRNTAMSSSNWQANHNAAIGLVGFLLSDQTLINEAINGTTRDNTAIWGFDQQICNLTDSDGFWNEGTGYHHAVMIWYVPLAEAARHAGVNLYDLDTKAVCNKLTPRTFSNMFKSTKKLVMPNGYLPMLEDAGWIQQQPWGELYDLAYAYPRFGQGDNFYPWLVKKITPSRGGVFDLLYGQETLPDAIYTPPSAVLKEVGYGALRAGTGDDASYALLDFGPWGGHGHYDKLNFALYQNRQFVMPDMGNASYGSIYSENWYRLSLSHNTFVVDGGTQARVAGQLIPIGGQDFKDDPNFKVILAKVDNAYPNTTAKRILALNQDYLIDSLEVSSTNNQSHTYDLPFHSNIGGSDSSSLTASVNLNPASLGYNTNGYQYLEATKSATLTGSFWAKWVQPATLNLQVNGLNPTSTDQIFSVVGPYPPLGNKKPFLIWRKTGINTKFISVIESYQEGQRK